jgi:hypothetical protein
MDHTITAARDSVEMTTTMKNCWVTDSGRQMTPLKDGWYLYCASAYQICGDQRKFVQYSGFTKMDERDKRDFAGKVADKAIGHGDI